MNFSKEILKDVPEDWLQLLVKYKTDFQRLESIVGQVDNVDTLPTRNLWFEWARLTQLSKIAVIIIGQDPYPNPGNAHGLAFSCLNSDGNRNNNLSNCVNNIPASLRNIYKCLQKSGYLSQGDLPKSGDLTKWAGEGVLLLNTALTVRTNCAGSHAEIWKDYMTRILFRILGWHKNVGNRIFVLAWGNYAHGVISGITDEFHIYMKYKHPSPLAGTSFQDCPHFIDVNKELVAMGKTPINWGIIGETKDDLSPFDTHIFCDGSCTNNGKKMAVGGFALIFTKGTYMGKKIYGRLEETYPPSNIRGEGFAILKTLIFLDEQQEWNLALIHTDSQFWIDMLMKFIPNWSENKFDKQKNSDLTRELWKMWQKINSGKRRVEFKFVRSHQRELELTDKYEKYCCRNNNKVDLLAKKSLELKIGEIISK